MASVLSVVSSLSYAGSAPAIRPASQAVTRAALMMQEAAGQPDIISTDGGYVEAPVALKDQLGAIGPLGYWDPLGMVRSRPLRRPCVRGGAQCDRVNCGVSVSGTPPTALP